MEAMRILKATGLKVRRTVRLALWSGEEQGLLGSRAYVAQQFADRQTMELKPAHAKVSVYFNMDNGAGAIRGVYLQGMRMFDRSSSMDGTVRCHGHEDADAAEHRSHRSHLVR